MTLEDEAEHIDMEVDGEYAAANIEVLDGLEPVRKRPGMYIGSTGPDGLHHLLTEVLDNSVDEAMAGHCDSIEVCLHENGSASVRDTGRGIPVDPYPNGEHKGKSAVEVVLTVLHAGGKFGGGGYKVSGGLHGVGISVVNALSEWVVVQVSRDGEVHGIEFAAETQPDGKILPGRPQGPIEVLQKMGKGESTGTFVQFKPDPSVFTTTSWDIDVIRDRLRSTCFLNPNLTIKLIDQRVEEDPTEESFCFERGLPDYLDWRVAARAGDVAVEEFQVAPDQVHLGGNDDGMEWEVAIAWVSTDASHVASFANGVRTSEGGYHVEGFRRSVTPSLNRFAKQTGMIADDESLTFSDLFEGMEAVVTIKMPDPQFEGQTKGKLGNVPARSVIEKGMNSELNTWLQEHAASARMILDRAINSMRARQAAWEAANKIKEERLSQPPSASREPLPAKLSDCDMRGKDRSEAEIFIVEGDSAAGPAKMCRDSRFQAVLPVRGKTLNAMVATDKQIYGNKEMNDLIVSMGAGTEDLCDVSKSRYGKVILLMDADADGCHIRMLLMGAYLRLMRPIVEAGYLYVAQPPLFSAIIRGERIYVMTEDERDVLAEANPNAIWTRFKGLGEMESSELKRFCVSRETRVLRQITVEEIEEAWDMAWRAIGGDAGERWELLQEMDRDLADSDLELLLSDAG